MGLLVVGLLLFLGAHSVRIVADGWRARVIARIGVPAWRAAYSLVSVAGLLLMIKGYGIARADGPVLYEAAAWTRPLASALMLPALVLLVAAYVPGTRIEAAIGHPMVAAVKLWAAVHLLAKVRQFEHQADQLDPNAEDHVDRTAQLQADKQAFQIAECQKRVERFPTDLGIRFERGALYFQVGKIGEAIQEFQKAQNNPHKRIASMNYLAQCFAKRKMYDLAAETLQNAIKEKPVFDEEKKELIYWLGTVLEKLGRREEAIVACRRATALRATDADAWNNLRTAGFDLGR